MPSVTADKDSEPKDVSKDEVKGDTEEDPLGKIASLSKVQGFLGVVADLTLEIYGRMGDLGITEIPINL